MEDERDDCKEAFQKAQPYHRELDEIYRYYQPFRQSTVERAPQGGGQTEGLSRTDHLFDGTGLSAAYNFAGNMVADWMPPFQDFFKLEAGPLWPKDQRDNANKQLSPVNEIAHAVLPKVRVTAHEMFGDLFAGTGAMYLSTGTDKEPVRGQTAPINELALREGPFGDIWHIWWKKNYRGRDIEETWPKAKISDKLAKAIKDDRKKMVEMVQSTRYDAKADRWVLRVYAESDDVDHLMFEEDYRTNPWMTPRFFKVPGECFGRGLGHLGLPFVKTANKTRELALRAAAFALMGIWMRRNDGVFNPDTAVFKPLAMWTVGTTGGPLGPSLQRLPVPQDFDVTSIVMNDERDQIKRVLLDDDLPELQDSVRSPTEIAARLRRAAKSKGGAGARISIELVTALAQRTVDILETRKMLDSNITIDQILTQCSCIAPAAAAQRADRVGWAVDWMQMMIGLFGVEAASTFAKVEELLPDLGRWMGNDERYMRSKGDQNEFRDVVASMVAKMQKSEAAAKAAPPPPGQQYVNGGAM